MATSSNAWAVPPHRRSSSYARRHSFVRGERERECETHLRFFIFPSEVEVRANGSWQKWQLQDAAGSDCFLESWYVKFEGVFVEDL